MQSGCNGFSFRRSILCVFLVFMLALFIGFGGTAGYAADTIRVTTLSDDGPGSLRAAIASANEYEDVISFDVTGNILLTKQLTIDHGLTIQGPGADLLYVIGKGASRVFYINTTALVDISGISIVNGDPGIGDGGGMYNDHATNLTVRNCAFYCNRATNGGGIYNNDCDPTITNCMFGGNVAGQQGGGMYNYESSPTVADCVFGDRAEAGGGMYNYESSPIVINCTFSGTRAMFFGGGMYNRYYSSPEVTNCTFYDNSAEGGGGMYNQDYSDPTVTNCTFTVNSADVGGGMENINSSPEVTNCTFYDNSAEEDGGGMFNLDYSSPTVINCTFSSNSADHGGGMCNGLYSRPTVGNCIFWGDDGGEIYNFDIDPIHHPILTFCIVQSNDIGDDTISIDIISANPELELLADNGGYTYTCALGAESSAIDAGTELIATYNNTIEAPHTDQRGRQRPWGAGYDIGAFEVDVESFTITPYWTSGGIVTPASKAVLLEGKSVDFTISPDIFYQIEKIYIDGDPISFEPVNDIYTYPFSNVSADHWLFVVFELDEYILSVDFSGSGNGTVAISPDLVTYPHGTEVILTADPGADSDFASWQGAISGDINPKILLIMNEAKEVTAVFNLKTYTITKNCSSHGSINGFSSVTWGSTPTYTIECDTGYAIRNVLLDGVSLGSVSSLTLDPVSANHTISVSFSFNPNMVSESGLEDFSLSDPNLGGDLLGSLLLPSGITSDDLDCVIDDSLEDIYMQSITAGAVAPLIEGREQGEVFVKGVSFDISYSQDGADWAILPLHVEMDISREDMGLEYAYMIDKEIADKGIRSAFLDHVKILKIISSDVYNLLEEAWEKYEEEDAKSFFNVVSDLDNYYVGMNLLVADAAADTPEMAVQAISDGVDRYFFIFDGERDGHFKDPLVAVIQPIDDNDGGGGAGGGGGCNISILPCIGLLFAIPLMFLSGKMK